MARNRKNRSRRHRGGAMLPLMPANFSLAQGDAAQQAGQVAQQAGQVAQQAGQVAQQAGQQPLKQAGGSQYGSAATYAQFVAGTENQQYNQTFSQAGPYGSVPGNTLIGQQGQGVSTQAVPTPQQLAMAQSAGGKSKKGGFLGPILNQATVPLALLALQQTYRRKSRVPSSSRRSRKVRRSRKSRR